MAIRHDGYGKLSFGVLGAGIKAGGGLGKETTATLEVDVLKNDEVATESRGDGEDAMEWAPPPG